MMNKNESLVDPNLSREMSESDLEQSHDRGDLFEQSKLAELMIARRTIHHFEPTEVPLEPVKRALELAVYAPNHHHTHPYRFYLMGEEIKSRFLDYAKEAFSERDPASAETKLARWKRIPGWILVTRKKSDKEKVAHEDYATLSIALYMMMLSLTAEGIGTKWSTGSLLFNEEVYKIFGLNSQEKVIEGLFWYGYPEKTPLPFPKPSFEQYVTELK
ncbi:putative NAD(P)H nitroreductase YfhC [Ignatzschineria indica]|uniref:Nitroreductase domain-containing protein n=1 Tax=Ignatzschineria indica TaxID=472583 RepID=A0A2U2AM85_9GAMM|nr:nitroreductase [Ignatzschineria indica]PWD84268.1 hypothetical protein DC082_01615 [Ignatzschineria indica]GGZ75178.1 putative NAD(P)H nitroreductase YfhC [Ignatzschineria indica]